MFDDNECETLKRYMKGAMVRPEDRDLLYRLSSTGVVRLGFSTEGCEPTETASLTAWGRRQLHRETIYRSPIRRLIYGVLSTLFD